MNLLTMMTWAAAFFGVAGTVLLALNGRRAGWGFVAFVASNAGWMTFAWIQSNWPLLTQYVAFTTSALLGIWLWLVRPRTKALPADVQAVLDAANNWWGERDVNDWDEADLVKALMTFNGDWPGCPKCDHECDEPCVPFTVAEGHRAIDCRIAQLVHDGKLLAHDGYKPPEGWTPRIDRRKQVRDARMAAWLASDPRTEAQRP
jgi:hypothetical protein